jgi:hypothetical protein
MPVHPTQGALHLVKNAKQRHKLSNRHLSTASTVPTAAKSSNNKVAGRKTKTRVFKLFNKLPMELRLKIWKYASQSPRLIAARSKTQVNEVRSQSFYNLYAGLVPIVLQINQESRNEALRYFKQIKKYIVFNGPDNMEDHIYIQERDTIYFLDIAPRHDFLRALRIINKALPLSQFAFNLISKYQFCNQKGPSTQVRKAPSILQSVVMEHPTLTRVVAVWDFSHFKSSKKPQDYMLQPLSKHRMLQWKDFCKNSSLIGSHFYMEYSWKTGDEQNWKSENEKRSRKNLCDNTTWKPPVFEVISVKKR